MDANPIDDPILRRFKASPDCVPSFRLTKDDARTDGKLRAFLYEGYEFKTIADYATGPEAITPHEEALTAMVTAGPFVDHFAALVPLVPGDKA